MSGGRRWFRLESSMGLRSTICEYLSNAVSGKRTWQLATVLLVAMNTAIIAWLFFVPSPVHHIPHKSQWGAMAAKQSFILFGDAD